MTSALRAALVIAASTWLQAVRNRVLVISVFFAVLLIATSLAAASLAHGERTRLIVDIGLAAQSALGAVMTLALAISVLSGDLRRRTAHAVLARPVPRWAFLAGKYLGVVAAMSGVVVLMALACAGTLLLYGGAPTAAFWGSVWLTLAEVAVVGALALLFATVTAPVPAAAYTTAVVIAGNLSEDLRLFAGRFAQDGAPGLSRALEVAYYVLPDLQLLSLRSQAANALDVPPDFLMHATLYAAAYALAALGVAMASISSRRQL